MKVKLIFTLMLMFLLRTSYSQTEGTYQPASQCSNYYAFLTGSTLDSLKYYTDTIFQSGIMNFDLSKSQEYGGVEDLYPLLGVDEGSTFALIKVVDSRFNVEKQYHRYQQYHQGVKVEGGGYTVAAYIPGPGNPCAKAYMLSPHIVSGISLSVQPRVALTSLDSILNGSVIQSGSQLSDADIGAELVITHSLLNNCEYYLAWKTIYRNEGAKISWIDANTGNIIKTIETEIDLTAPMATAAYGTPNLSNVMNGNIASMISVDGRVRTHNFGAICPANPVIPAQWTVGLIPTTTAATWTTEAAPTVYQAHHVVSSVLPVFDEVAINFGTVNVASCTGFGATSLLGSTVTNAFIEFAIIDGSTTALFDVAAHELGHTFLFDFLDYTNPGNQSLHEGIADMIGTYAESIIQAIGVDWIIGDDEVNVAEAVDRDLQNPGNDFDCFTDVAGLGSGERHNRSKPLGHWFYLISQGEGPIIGLGLNKALLIVLESLNLMGINDDYGDMREAVIAFVDDEFGPCSLEGYTVRRAWNEICVGLSDYTDCFFISGNPWVCEEDDAMHLWIENPAQGAIYRWTFPIEWTVQGSPGNPSGNLYVGNHFVVTDFPKYSSYPRYFTLKVYSPALGPAYTQHKRVKLIDCNGDDPKNPCPDSFSSPGGDSAENRSIDNPGNTITAPDNGIALMKVHDLFGRLLYSGRPDVFNQNSIISSGIYVHSYFDENGRLFNTEKNFVIRQ